MPWENGNMTHKETAEKANKLRAFIATVYFLTFWADRFRKVRSTFAVPEGMEVNVGKARKGAKFSPYVRLATESDSRPMAWISEGAEAIEALRQVGSLLARVYAGSVKAKNAGLTDALKAFGFEGKPSDPIPSAGLMSEMAAFIDSLARKGIEYPNPSGEPEKESKGSASVRFDLTGNGGTFEGVRIPVGRDPQKAAEKAASFVAFMAANGITAVERTSNENEEDEKESKGRAVRMNAATVETKKAA